MGCDYGNFLEFVQDRVQLEVFVMMMMMMMTVTASVV
jgi:hypothetical protein